LARPLDDARAFGRQSPEVHAARLVRAVLAPHHAEDAELGVARLATERTQDDGVLVGADLVLRDERRLDRVIARKTIRHGSPVRTTNPKQDQAAAFSSLVQ